MQSKKLNTTRLFQQIAALRYNPFFIDQVKGIRNKYDIKVGDKASDWFINVHCAGYSKCVWPIFYEESEQSLSEVMQIGKEITDTDVPLEQEIIFLLLRFRLPLVLFYGVLNYILNDKMDYIYYFYTVPKVEFKVESRKCFPEMNVTIKCLQPWTTKKQWDAVWESHIQPNIEVLNQAAAKILNLEKPANKRANIDSYEKQMKKWAEWYRLSEIEKHGPAATLRIWAKKHQDELDCDKDINESTVIKAIHEFQSIITPDSNESLNL